MEDKIVFIPIDKSKFNDEKIEKAKNFLNVFLGDKFKCSFVYDDETLCLKIMKS